MGRKGVEVSEEVGRERKEKGREGEFGERVGGSRQGLVERGRGRRERETEGDWEGGGEREREREKEVRDG